jgi:glycosyltransferase involved in cell wall biosynthesis
MRDEPLVSIVMAVYRGANEEHLQLALKSILEQSYRNIEIVVVVDGEIDARKRALLRNLDQAKLITLLNLPANRGPAAARNAGILKAKGDYIAIMDADDIADKNRISTQKSFLEIEKVDIVSSGVYLIDQNGTVIGERVLPRSVPGVSKLAPYRCPLHNPAAFGRADVFKSNLYDESYRVSEDYELWVRLLSLGYRLSNCEERTVLYRQGAAALRKRRGWVYVFADLRVKRRAVRLVVWYEKPIVLLLAVLAASARLLPSSVFEHFYKLKDTLNKRLLNR